MHPFDPDLLLRGLLDRRRFLEGTAAGLGMTALGTLLAAEPTGQAVSPVAAQAGDGAPRGLPGLPHFAPRAKRIIYLFQSGAPSQMELFDYKPGLANLRGQELPDSVRQGQRLTGMTAGQTSFPIAPSIFKFARHGQSGAWMSELLPHLSGAADELCIVKSLFTEAINHDPAITFLTTGAQLAGRPSIGAWMSYGLGTENRDLPAFVVMVSRGTGRPSDQPLYDRLWGSGFLPSQYQGVKFRSVGDPVLYLSNPPGVSAETRRQMLDELAELNRMKLGAVGDPEIAARIAQYELAFRMQTSAPSLTDVSDEPEHVFELYGPDAKKPGTFAANCLLARRMAERGVRFVQLFHMGWDQHNNLPGGLRGQCSDTDQPAAALIKDLKRRGLLDETLVVWGGEFGRTVYCQGHMSATNYGRDHHPRCFTIWMAGGGVKRGVTIGETCDHSYNITADPIHVHDLNATILHLMGVAHDRLTFKFQGRQHRLTDVHGHVVEKLLG